MNIKFLTTTFVSMSLLSINLLASGQMGCTGGFCMVKIQKPSPKIHKIEVKSDTKVYETIVVDHTDAYKEIVVDNIDTIVLPHSKFVMTENEVAEYELDEMQKNLTEPALNLDLPNSDFLCEDNLKPIKVAGIENTYECS